MNYKNLLPDELILVAKNLLLDKTCNNCLYKGRRYCGLIPSGNQKYLEDKDIPTCERWEKYQDYYNTSAHHSNSVYFNYPEIYENIKSCKG